MPESAITAYLRTLSQARGASSTGAWHDAIALWRAVTAANPTEGRSWEALAEACYRAGEYARAIAACERMLALGAGYPAEATYRIAGCRALLGERDRALDTLDRAFALGYRYVDEARADPDFAALRDDPRFATIVGLSATDDLPRDEGWRTDLAHLVREIKRLGYAPFRLVTEEAFDARVAALHEAIPTSTDAQIAVELMKLMRLVDDGHTRLRDLTARPALARTLPVQFYLFEEGLFIVASAPEHGDLLGAQVIGWAGQPVEAVCAALEPLIARDNDQWVRQMTPYHLRETAILHALGFGDDPGRATLAIRDRAGREREVTIAADDTRPNIFFALSYPPGWHFFPETLDRPVPRYLRSANANYWFDYLPEQQLAYFQFNRVRDDPAESLDAFTARLFRFIAERPVAKLVLDLRWNNGGNTFLELPLIHRLIACDAINQPGKLFVIIGRRTFSAAQNGATLIERHTSAIFVGEPTGSRPNFVGESIPFALPYSGLMGTISDLYWQSSWPMDHRTWIAPRLYTPPTFAAYTENRDVALEAILAYGEYLPGG